MSTAIVLTCAVILLGGMLIIARRNRGHRTHDTRYRGAAALIFAAISFGLTIGGWLGTAWAEQNSWVRIFAGMFIVFSFGSLEVLLIRKYLPYRAYFLDGSRFPYICTGVAAGLLVFRPQLFT